MSIKGLYGSAEGVRCEVVNFEVSGAFGRKTIEHALIIPNLELPQQTLSVELVQYINDQEKIKLWPFKNAQICILIGQDNWPLIMSEETRQLGNSGLALSRSSLGWSVHGYLAEGKELYIRSSVSATCVGNCSKQATEEQESEELEKLINKYIEFENLGVVSMGSKGGKHERARAILEVTTRKISNGWETGLLWRSGMMPKIDSRSTALKRLYLVEKKLGMNPKFAEQYYKEIERLIENKYAEKVSKNLKRPRIWYIPHFGIQNLNKSEKVRLVFDAAAKTRGLSINDLLETGPDLLESLLGVLLRFRQFPVAVIADIKDMYLRVSLIERDRGAQRFLCRGTERDREPDEYENTSLIFGSKSSPCSAVYVKNKNAERFSSTMPEAARSIVKNSYMDDYLASGETIPEMRKRVHEVIMINKEVNFNMHSWASNEPSVVEEVHNENTGIQKAKINLCDDEERVLGLFWDKCQDTLSFNVGLKKIRPEVVRGEVKPTKREFISIIMSVYDPLGIIAPFVLQAKMIMQNIWRSGVKWDSCIREEEFRPWLNWLKSLSEIRKIKIPRCYLFGNIDYSKVELHVSCDASLKAYSTVAYLRSETTEHHVRISLVMSKSRVAPTKPMTVPRLELQAALLGARMAATITKELEIKVKKRIFWSDSTTVLHWIRGDAREKQMFVANRLGEIGDLTRVADWRWVPTKLNPADDATRETDIPMHVDDRWLVGPEFLLEREEKWPKQKSLQESQKKEINELESRKEFIGAMFVEDPSKCVLSVRYRILGWNRIRLSAERVRKMFFIWRYTTRKIQEKTLILKRHSLQSPLVCIEKKLPEERAALAEKFWYRDIQAAHFPLDIELLRKGKEISRGSKLRDLAPFLDDEGLLRARGRASKLLSVRFQNRPIILDAKHFATKLLIAEFHRRYNHANNETIVNELRQEFYIVGLRTRLRWLAKHCVICCLRRGKPEMPPMADLPKCRLAHNQRPFTHCGVDYFGPLLVKIGRRREKRWGVLFTCMTTRAIHLELAHTLNASSAIMAMQRFASRRGFPCEIYSDNGTNFVKANKELKDAIASLDSEKQRQFAEKNRFKWHFNPPDAPHMGGAWERLIRSVKDAMNYALNDQVPSEELLLTLLIEIEHMVNSRPLTHVSVDPQDEEALTPNHFLIGASSGHLRFEKYETETFNSRKAFETAQHLANIFWKRWLREYLPTLLPRKKWHTPVPALKIGDIVLIIDYQAPRNMWKTGRVVEVYPNKEDNVLRVVKLRVAKKELTRPVHKLIRIFGDSE